MICSRGEQVVADQQVAAAAATPAEEEEDAGPLWEEQQEDPKMGRTHEMLSSSRVWRRRVGERRITAPVRVVNAFVLALVRLPPPKG